jgi:hypothetical protein
MIMRRSILLLSLCSLIPLLEGCASMLTTEAIVGRSGSPRPSVSNPMGVDHYTTEAGGFGPGRPSMSLPNTIAISPDVHLGVGNRPLVSPVSPSTVYVTVDAASEFLCRIPVGMGSPQDCGNKKRFDGVLIPRQHPPIVHASQPEK